MTYAHIYPFELKISASVNISYSVYLTTFPCPNKNYPVAGDKKLIFNSTVIAESCQFLSNVQAASPDDTSQSMETIPDWKVPFYDWINCENGSFIVSLPC